MSLNYLHSDWRVAPTTSEKIERMFRFWTGLDAQGAARVRLSQWRGAASLVQRSGEQPMVLREDVNTLRKGKSQVLYWARMYSMARTIADMLADSQQLHSGPVEYKEVSTCRPLKAV